MDIKLTRTTPAELSELRQAYREQANCQIVHDSSIARGFTEPFLIEVDDVVAGYGAKFVKHYPGRAMEFYVLPEFQEHALPMFREFLHVSGATEIEAQSNMQSQMTLLYESGKNLRFECVLFRDGFDAQLASPGGEFRRRSPADAIRNEAEPEGDWVIEFEGEIVANGGYLTHYNPPYADIYMEALEGFRRRGFGSYLVQGLRRVCAEAGFTPAARCNPQNVASRRTLEKAGFAIAGHMVVAEV